MQKQNILKVRGRGPEFEAPIFTEYLLWTKRNRGRVVVHQEEKSILKQEICWNQPIRKFKL